MVAAGQPAHILAVHRRANVAVEQESGDQSDLIDVVALLPPPHLAPRDLVRRVHQIEGVSGDAPRVALMRGDAEVAELEAIALADEDVERREIAMKRVATVQHIERAGEAGDLAADEALRLRALPNEEGAEVAVRGVFHGQAIAHLAVLDLSETVEYAKRSFFAAEQLGEIGFAQPAGEAVADLDTDLRGKTGTARRREIDLAEAAFADESFEAIGAAGLGAVRPLNGVHRGLHIWSLSDHEHGARSILELELELQLVLEKTPCSVLMLVRALSR